MPNTLGLIGDGDEVDFVRDIERALAIRLPNDGLNRCTTVGDVHDLVRAETVPVDRGAACGSSAVFYALRRALAPEARGQLKPETRLDSLGFRTARDLYRHLWRATRLRLPAFELTGFGNVAWLALLLGAIVMLAAASDGSWRAALWIAAALAAPAVLLWFEPGRLPKNIVTVGDLVRQIAALNAPELRETGRRPPDSWDIIAALAADHGGLAPDKVSQDTRLIAERQRK